MKPETAYPIAIYGVGGLVLGASLFALGMCTAKAEPAQIPAKYRGEWCEHPNGGYYVQRSPNACKRFGTGYMHATATIYEGNSDGEPFHCRVVEVKEGGPLNTDGTAAFAEHVITFTCTVEGKKDVPLTAWFGMAPHGAGDGVDIPLRRGSSGRLYTETVDSDQR
jgi:hypothetical protein